MAKRYEKNEKVTYALFSGDKEALECILVMLMPFIFCGFLYLIIEVFLFGFVLK